MRLPLRTACPSALFCFGALFCFLGPPPACVTATRPSRRIATTRGNKTVAFSSIELAKIFGRLADNSPIGSVLRTSCSKQSASSVTEQPKWRTLFKTEEEELRKEIFGKRLSKATFSWPTYYVANRQPPFLVPEKQRHKFKLKGYLGYVATESHKPEDPSDGSTPSEKARRSLAKQPIVAEALDSVFKAFSHDENTITVGHVLAFIKYRSPLLEMVNWEGFIASLPVGPEDIPV